MPKKFQHLSKSAINTMLPYHLRLKEKKYRGGIYMTEGKELIGHTESKYYDDNELFYSLFIDLLEKYEVNNVCLSVFNKGILLLPLTLLSELKEVTHSKLYQNDLRYNLHIIEENYNFTLCKAKNGYTKDLTNYFIPYEDVYIKELYNSEHNKILQDAIDYKDSEQQYNIANNVKQRIESKKQKERIAILENHTCQICGFNQSYINESGNKKWIIEVDHIIEKSKGGGETIDNLMVLCPNCHAKKTYGIIKVDKDYRVFENNKEIQIKDHHLKMIAE